MAWSEVFSAIDVSGDRLMDLHELDHFLKGIFNNPNELTKTLSSKDLSLFFAFLDLDNNK